jgi:hypothetical protein
MVRDRLMRQFIAVWAAYWLLVAVLPVHSIYQSTPQAFFLQLAFVIFVLVSYQGTLWIIRGPQLPVAERRDDSRTPMQIYLALAMSAVGLAFLAYDKVVIQGIDFGEGVAAAREEWRELGESREGAASSIFSALGYLFGSAYFVAAVLIITRIGALYGRRRLVGLMVVFGLLMANSLLTGGRSSVLLMAAVLAASVASRRDIRWHALFPRPSHRRAMYAVASFAALYLVFIFYQRAEAGETAALEYALDFLPFLGLEVQEWFAAELDGSFLSGLSAMLVLAASYVTHSLSTTAAILEAPPEGGTLLFLHWLGIFHKLGWSSAPDGDWFLSGRMPSLPGALWYQVGLIGFVVASIAIGFLCACARRWLISYPQRVLPSVIFSLMGAVLLLSPALLAVDFLSFPYILAAGLMIAGVDRLSSRCVLPAGTGIPRPLQGVAAVELPSVGHSV